MIYTFIFVLDAWVAQTIGERMVFSQWMMSSCLVCYWQCFSGSRYKTTAKQLKWFL